MTTFGRKDIRPQRSEDDLKTIFFLIATIVTAELSAAPSYFAPTSLLGFRMRQANGLFREFDRGARSVEELVGGRGWHGEIKGDEVVVQSRVKGGSAGAEYRFKGGRPVGSVCELPPDGEPIDVLWPQAQKGRRNARAFFDVWKNVGRFRWGYKNPNKTGLLFAEFGLLALGLALFRRRWCVAVGLVAAAVSFFLVVKTGSRSGVLAFLAGAAVIGAFAFRARLPVRRVVLIALPVAVAIFLCGPQRVTRHLLRPDGERVRILRAAPRMMVDAPGGWGWYAGGYMTGPGKAYHDWYQPLRRFSMPLTLVSDHLTQLVRFGWLGRFGYLFGWMALLIWLLLGAWRKTSPLALALWSAFLVSTGANRVMNSWTLWIAPVAVTVAVLPGLLRTLSRRQWLVGGICSALAGLLVLGGVCWLGSFRKRSQLAVRTEDGRIYLKSRYRPKTWVVDDGTVLGGGFAAKEIRLFYRKNRKASPLGYVRDVMKLPNDVKRLVLAGQSGWDFLKALHEGTFPAAFSMPKKILFISPPFPPRAIPELMLRNVDVRMVTGEFAAAYFAEDYRKAPTWAAVVPGAELYVPDWLDRVNEL